MKFKVAHLIFLIFIALLFTQCTPDKKPETGINNQSITAENSKDGVQPSPPDTEQNLVVSNEQTIDTPAANSEDDTTNSAITPSSNTENETDGIPVLYIAEKIHKFKPVYDGIYIEHDFIIENKGTSELKIIKAKGT